MSKAYIKWFYDIKDCQRISGQLPSIIPTSAWGWCISPAWDAALFIIPWQMYNTYGDKTVLELVYENMERYLNFLFRAADDFIIELWLGDWCPPKNQKCDCPAVVTSTAYFYMASDIMVNISKVLNKESKKWEDMAQDVKIAWRKKFLGDLKLYDSQTFLACGIYCGLLTADEEKAFSKKLSELVIDNDYHTDCGILGQKFIFDALCKYGYHEVVYKMVVNPTMPSYAYWFNNGATTLCETWSMNSSNNHNMFSEVDNWMYKYIGGLNFSEGELTINPIYFENISEVDVKYKNLTVRRKEKSVFVSAKEKVYVIVGNKKIELENDELMYLL